MERLKFFDKDTIAWSKENLLHNFYKTLLQLRRRHPALRAGDADVTTSFIKTSAEESVLAWKRKRSGKEVLVFLNLSSHELELTAHDEEIRGKYTNIFTDIKFDLTAEGSILIGPWDAVVLEK